MSVDLWSDIIAMVSPFPHIRHLLLAFFKKKDRNSCLLIYSYQGSHVTLTSRYRPAMVQIYVGAHFCYRAPVLITVESRLTEVQIRQKSHLDGRCWPVPILLLVYFCLETPSNTVTTPPIFLPVRPIPLGQKRPMSPLGIRPSGILRHCGT